MRLIGQLTCAELRGPMKYALPGPRAGTAAQNRFLLETPHTRERLLSAMAELSAGQTASRNPMFHAAEAVRSRQENRLLARRARRSLLATAHWCDANVRHRSAIFVKPEAGLAIWAGYLGKRLANALIRYYESLWLHT
jgi:hypothetical protein